MDSFAIHVPFLKFAISACLTMSWDFHILGAPPNGQGSVDHVSWAEQRALLTGRRRRTKGSESLRTHLTRFMSKLLNQVGGRASPTYRTIVGASFLSSICPAAASLRALRLRQWYQVVRTNARTMSARMEKMPARRAGLALRGKDRSKVWSRSCRTFKATYPGPPPLSLFPPLAVLAVWKGFGATSEKLKVLKILLILSPGIPVERGPATVLVE